MFNKKRILVAPLNWGLGHASRCIPIIRELLENNNEVIIAADASPLLLLRTEFPQLQSIQLKGVEINYPRSIPFSLYFGIKLPRLLASIRNENEVLKSLVKEHQIEVVISDNRYGLYNDKVTSVMITHQLFIKTPFFQSIVRRLLHAQLQKFNECWVPDVAGSDNFSGELSHGSSQLKHLKYIGLQSRFKKPQQKEREYKRKVIVILSGPEPHRTNLEQLLLEQLSKLDLKVLMVQGKVKKNVERELLKKGIEIVSHLPTEQLQEEILESEWVICRSGYSSIMDLITLNKKAILIPTKGQTEQEYLAEYHNERNCFIAVKENDLDLQQLREFFKK